MRSPAHLRVLAITLIAFAACAHASRAQSVAWTARYDGGESSVPPATMVCEAIPYYGEPVGRVVATDVVGNMYVGLQEGEHDIHAKSLALMKMDGDGRVVWSRTWVQRQQHMGCPIGAITVDADQNVYVVGVAFAWDDVARPAIQVLKFGPDGDLLWRVLHEEPDFVRIDLLGVAGSHVAVDARGNVYVSGTMRREAFSAARIVTLKLSPEGRLIWSAVIDKPVASAVYGLALDRDGNPHVLVDFLRDVFLSGQLNLVKYSALDGQALWTASGPQFAPGVLAVSMALDSAGNAYVLARSLAFGDTGAWTTKYAHDDGRELWAAHATASPGEYYRADVGCVAVDDTGSVYVGITMDASTPDPSRRQRIIRYAASDGGLVWDRSYRDSGELRALVLGAQGDLFTAGWHGTVWAPTGDALMMRVAAHDGQPLWRIADGRFRRPAVIVVDVSGDVLALTTNATPAALVRYDGDDGQRTRSIPLKLPRAGNDQPGWGALVVDAMGAAYVGGASEGHGRLVKHAPDGQIEWIVAPEDAGPITHVALDRGGDVHIVAESSTGLLVMRYSPAGALVWRATADLAGLRPAGWVVDAAGNTYVGGWMYVSGGDTSVRWYLLKYAPDGTLQWRVAAEGAAFLAIDSAGNVLAAGSVFPDYRSLAVATAKYAAVNGARLWSARFSAEPNRIVATGLALDADDNVYAQATTVLPDATGYQAQLLKYAGATGEVLWSVDTGLTTWPAGLTSDQAGQPYVASATEVSKRDSATGVRLWSTTLSHDQTEFATGLVADRFGRLLLTGGGWLRSPRSQRWIYRTLVLDADTGAMRASLLHDPGQSSYAMAVATDAVGSVYVTGRSENERLDLDFLTIKYVTSAPQTDLHLTLDDGVSHVTAGTRLIYRIRVSNAGPLDATSATVRQQVPSGCTRARWTCTAWSGARCAPEGSGSGAIDQRVFLPVGGRAEYVAVCELSADATGTLTQSVTVTSLLADPNPANNVASDTDTIIAPTDLALVLRDDRDPVPPGGNVLYRARYTNLASSAASDVELRLSLSRTLQFVSASAGTGSCEEHVGVVRCALGRLEAGASGELTVAARAMPDKRGWVSVRAELDAHEDDPNLADNVAQERTRVKVQRGDVQNDLATDLLLEHVATGEPRVWLMDGTTRLAEASFEPALPSSATARLVGLDDFDGDGHNDILFRDSATGAIEFWLMDGLVRRGPAVALTSDTAPSLSWRLAGTGDFDGDGGTDLLWQDEATRELVIWTLAGTIQTGTRVPQPARADDPNWELAGAPDLNDDGVPDLVWFDRATGTVTYWWLNQQSQRVAQTTTRPAAPSDVAWRLVALGDYGAGPVGQPETVDLVWRHEQTGRLAVWHMGLAGNRTSGSFLSPDAPSGGALWTVVGPR